MKKIVLGFLLLPFLMNHADAQISQPGFPLSIIQKIEWTQEIPEIRAPLPDWEKAQENIKNKADQGHETPFTIGLFSATDISFPASGSFSYLPDGHVIWRTRLVIEGAPAIGLYYDHFKLPQGVKLYLSNANGRQTLGAYTAENNAENGVFANEPVQGDVVNLELDIAPKVSLEQVKLHIFRALVYFTSVSYLQQYATVESGSLQKPTGLPDPYGLEGSSSTCEIDATCPLGQNHPIQRKSTVQLLIPFDSFSVGGCSGIMINNTGNTPGNCTPYLLTATHCEPGDFSSSSAFPFEYMLVRFSFEKTSCNSMAPATVNTLNGVDLIARSNYVNTSIPAINGDFMLLQLKENIPASWDVYLSGWNRGTNMPLPPLAGGKKYFSFHHPAADIKKVTTFGMLSPDGDANGSAGPGTHWFVAVDSGGIEEGSSGSALFDGDGLSIGIASVAGGEDQDCNVNGKGQPAMFLTAAEYSKLSYDWNYSEDGPSSFRKLQPWLDPINSGAITLDPVHSNCTAVSDTGGSGTGIIIDKEQGLDQYINVYPNPSLTGIVHAAFQFPSPTDLRVAVYNITGQKVKAYFLKNVGQGTYSFDLSGFPNSLYLIRMSNNTGTSTHKIVKSER